MGYAGTNKADDVNSEEARTIGEDARGYLENVIGDPASFLGITGLVAQPYDEAHRPQDVRYTFPERGTENHGLQDDTLTKDYIPNKTDDGQIATFDVDQPLYKEWIPAIPIPVYVLPNPQATVNKTTRILSVFGQSEFYTGAVGAVDVNSIRRLLGTDDNRISATFRVGPTPGGTVDNYWFAISQSDNFAQCIILNSTMGTFVTTATKGDWWVALVPKAAYGQANVSLYALDCVVEYGNLVDRQADES